MLVDSKKKKLDTPTLILEAVKHVKSKKYTPDQVLASIMTEANEAGAILMRQGNTLYVVHKGKDRMGVFRVLNADTPKNLIENSILFCKAIYMAGFDVLTIDFEQPSIISVFKHIFEHRKRVNPDVNGKPSMGYSVQKGKNGYRLTAVLGPKREGQI